MNLLKFVALKPQSVPMTDFSRFLLRAETLIDRLEAILPPTLPVTDWSACAFRWRTRSGRGWLEGVRHPHAIRLTDLQGVSNKTRDNLYKAEVPTMCYSLVHAAQAKARSSRPH